MAAACGSDDVAIPTTTSEARTSTSQVRPTTSGVSGTLTVPSTTTSPPPRLPLEGFGDMALRVVDAVGSTLEWCVLLADDDATWQQGLMDQTSLRGYDGMLFAFDANTSSSFWMRNTLIPLSIAFFREDGSFVYATDMEPCARETADADCPRYGPSTNYRYALEVTLGDLQRLGIGEGSRIELGAACPSRT